MRVRSINIPSSIVGVCVNEAGHLIVTFKDGSSMDAGYVVGPPGNPGAGTAGKNAVQPTFSATVALGAVGSDATVNVTSVDGVAQKLAFALPKPKDGIDGKDGVKGGDGTTPSISIGTVTTLALGATPTVRRKAGDTDATPVFDFGLPGAILGGSFDVQIPAILLAAVGVLKSATVNVPGAKVGMLALASPPRGLMPSLSKSPLATVTADGVVTIDYVAAVAIAAQTATFIVRVIP